MDNRIERDYMRIGILGCSDIAFKRFMPAIDKVKNVDAVVVGEEYNPSRLKEFCDGFNLESSLSFQDVILREDIDAVYIPQPPALHFQWVRSALEHGKHVLVEKPSTTAYDYSKHLVELADSRGLALHENYMFQYHKQISIIKEIVEGGEIGEIRLIRCSFEFPMRKANDFRYVKELGGGALLDAGGYAVKLATLLLGEKLSVSAASLGYIPEYDVDMFGNATLVNEKGIVCQLSFGMDCAYRCCLEVWGSKGNIFTNRIFTAPADYMPHIVIKNNKEERNIEVESDDHFARSIEEFIHEIKDIEVRRKMHDSIILQAKIIDEIKNTAGGRRLNA